MSRTGGGSRRGTSPRPTPASPVNGALISMLAGPADGIAERVDGVLDLRKRRPRFDREGRRLARIHSVFRPGRETGGGRERGKVLPMIRLSGRWLRESGFPVGQRYSVEVEDGELVIRAL